MSIKLRLVLLTTSLQLLSLLLLSGGVLLVFRAYGERQVAQSEEMMRHAIARTALDALIARDQVQLLSYLSFLKGQYPALTQAEVSWRRAGRETNHRIGGASGGGHVELRRVTVNDPAQPDQSVEVVFGVDRETLRRPVAESLRRTVKILAAVALGTALIGLMLSSYFAHALTRPLASLGALAAEVGRGRFGSRLEWDSEDELGVLVRAFNEMSARLEEFDQVKRNFVSSVTHELRSPLGAIESYLPLILEKWQSGPDGARQAREYLDRIKVNVRRLSGFINDLLDVAKIEKGKMECVLRPVELAPVAQDVCQFFEAKAAQAGVRLSNEIGPLPVVLADAERVRQVLVNLVANSLKFTPSGGRIWIAAEQFRERDARWVEVIVGDSGRGMDSGDVSRIFQPFAQGRNTHEGVAGHKGTGLGLYIVKSIVDQHGGKIGVDSKPGQGTTVRFSLRVAA